MKVLLFKNDLLLILWLTVLLAVKWLRHGASKMLCLITCLKILKYGRG